VVIIGGGFGGLSAAKRLRSADVQVTLLDRKNHHVFQPLLYQVATATLSPGDIAAPIRWILRRVRNVRVLMAEATGIDVAAKRVEVADGGSLPYDYLIVASGSRHAYFGHGDWEAHAPGLKTLEDAIAIRRRILLAFERAERESDPARQRELLTFVLVGGGPTGVELAGTLAEIAKQTLRDDFRTIDTSRARIVLIEASPSILATFPESLRASAKGSLERLGVEVHEGIAVTSVDDHGVTYGSGERLEAGTVVWAAGVAASPLVATLGVPLDRAGRVIVGPDLSVPRHPEVFVVGDMAAATSADDGARVPAVAQGAIQMGRHAGSAIAREVSGAAAPADRPAFAYRDRGSMAVIGKAKAVVEIGRFAFGGFWLFWGLIHIYFLIGFRNRLQVFLSWFWNWLLNARDARLITGDAHLALAAPPPVEPPVAVEEGRPPGH
jgi:NADH:quinone reductase (non-electrogenic)